MSKNRPSVYYISEAKENLPNYIRLVMLSEEEACMLNRLLDMLADTNPLKSELRRKLSGLSEMDHWDDYSVSQMHARNIEIIGYAIRMKQKVVLRGYGSSHSGTIRDRVVEPYRILEDGAYITAYDCHSSSCRVFKVMRMKSVDLIGSQWESEHLHEDMFIDVFRMSGVPRYSVTILLTLRARNLMIEEFPLSRKHIRWYAKRMWRFHAQVCALEGIGRFVLGLPEDVQIVLLTPIHRGPAKFSETNVQPSEEYCNACGEYIDAYVNVIKEASAIWSVPVIDMYSLCGLLPSRPEHSIYVPGGNDFLHPNQEDHRRMALCLYHQLKSIPSSF